MSMVTARPSSPPGGAPPRGAAPGGKQRAAGRPAWDWRLWAIVGLCFGVGYAASLRLLSLGGPEEEGASQRFDVQPAPGTTLDSLRQRFGGDAREIRGDLDLLELEQEQNKEAAAIEERRRQIEEREAEERRRLLEGGETPPTDQPAAPGAADAGLPAAPALPPPRTPPAREREEAGPAPIAPPPLSAPPAPGSQP
ncbi:hypothetical protein [Aphanothece minutissima]|uniref:hypothetical protein n=2 Tax=Cyanophyceae TaxID=3028117 RepID=UPI0015E64B78|nr:hypothetical protein [Aphanothece minutissima]